MARENDSQKKEKDAIISWLKTIGKNAAWLASWMRKSEHTVKGFLYGIKKISPTNLETINEIRSYVESIATPADDGRLIIPETTAIARFNPLFDPVSNKDISLEYSFYINERNYQQLSLYNGWANSETRLELSEEFTSLLTAEIKESLKALKSNGGIKNPPALDYFSEKYRIVADPFAKDYEEKNKEQVAQKAKYTHPTPIPEEIYKYANIASFSLNNEHKAAQAPLILHRSLSQSYDMFPFTDDYINACIDRIFQRKVEASVDDFLAD